MSDDYLSIIEFPDFELLSDLKAYAQSNWLQFIDCDRKCTFSPYCMFINQNPYIRNKDRHCAFIEKSLDTIIEYQIDKYPSYSKELKRKFAIGLYWYLENEFDNIMQIGFTTDNEYISSFENYYGHILSQVSSNRISIDRIAHFWKDLPNFDVKENILFVEGQSEKLFIEALKSTGIYNFTRLNIKVYNGRGNIKPERAEMMIDDYVKKGYEVKIEGDKDGKKKELFKKFIDIGLIKKANTFLFEYDFESSIPDKIMFYVLRNLSLFSGSLEEYCKSINGSRPISRSLESIGININHSKTKIAVELGEILSNPHNSKMLNSERFLDETEIGRFIKFIE